MKWLPGKTINMVKYYITALLLPLNLEGTLKRLVIYRHHHYHHYINNNNVSENIYSLSG